MLFNLPPNVLIMSTPGHLPWELKAWFSCVVCVRLKTIPHPKKTNGNRQASFQGCSKDVASQNVGLLLSFNVNHPCGGF